MLRLMSLLSLAFGIGWKGWMGNVKGVRFNGDMLKCVKSVKGLSVKDFGRSWKNYAGNSGSQIPI